MSEGPAGFCPHRFVAVSNRCKKCKTVVTAEEKARVAEMVSKHGGYEKRLVGIVERCYLETRSLEPGSVPESDALWTAAEEMMQLVATHRGEKWKTVKEPDECPSG